MLSRVMVSKSGVRSLRLLDRGNSVFKNRFMAEKQQEPCKYARFLQHGENLVTAINHGKKGKKAGSFQTCAVWRQVLS